MHRLFAVCLFSYLVSSLCPALAEGDSTPLEKQTDQAWDVVWSRFYQEEVQTFADYLSSYEPGKELAHLPTAEEVKRQYPNPCGYSTGMEDGAILGGAMLSLIVDRYTATGEEEMKAAAEKVFRGLERCCTVHGVRGFVARNVCAEDGKSTYINSSRDQVTHCVHGLWRYYHSPLPDEGTKTSIASLLAAIADRMIEYVVPENDYDFCRADGSRDPLGISRMWNVQAHEAARLPMIYAAAWDTTGEEIYRTKYRELIAEAVDQSRTPKENKPAYALLQMQCSLEVLHALETDTMLKTEIHKIMLYLADLGIQRAEHTAIRLSEMDRETLAMTGPDWRKVTEWKDQSGYQNPQWGPYRNVWHRIREAGEANLIPLMVAEPDVSPRQAELLRDLIVGSDYLHNSSCGIVYHLAAYWRAQALGVK